jgi:hypothetical protein
MTQPGGNVGKFHHASTENRTYATLLNHLKPKVLLGLASVQVHDPIELI